MIHGALLVGQVLFGAAAFFVTKSTVINLKATSDPLFYIVPAFTLIGLFAGTFQFKQKLAGMATTGSLNEKLTIYQTALIIRYALTEGPALLGIVAYFSSGNLFYLIIAGIDVLYFIMIRPTRSKLEDDLGLSYEDKTAMGI
jgi:hypothetical protein